MAMFYIYKDVSRGFRWRLKSVNGRIIADSGESYEAKQGAEWAVGWMKKYTRGAGIVDLTE